MSITVSQHPIVRTALTHLRDKKTTPEVFRRELHRLSQVLAVDATQHLVIDGYSVQTPLAKAPGFELSGQQALIPIMRAGSGMLAAFLGFLPNAYVWHMTMSRNEETLEPEFHGSKVPAKIAPNIDTCFILDPMLATGGSACLAIDYVKKAGAERIVFVGVLGAPEGAARLQNAHPDVPIIIGAMDERLNEHGYIMPGLGDAGDRLFPTT
ncbi:uracil phosphoribosyltransferase [Candidatus Uhrbacteria bacterium RIFCSPHIGHO2_02_FULL_47_44]|uniref:Uracil phosphoribosyltransferase n=1 Tax=Candidatus Uhrbacteria bacterium RIFCSPLOWO2_02_FULL_48_18 TaxID=1802408 RepID=A0A1F7V9J0_9BACT|nr:MAG: uracil phosphoribosyltransferase [Candidatus Uhrbacteria bacterium RIFCSPHIGHO2_01_FULL_47_10]OGL70666.1 MAG: uracil phosphoribosyltransferase [Candidatus Uhrbacteria bacterium RIFCSPHIGHO2_02_FULL_47_44]OGL82247.1 MAG: uracil phosphoribosyltransferase [Candidatus Uhrbacteria bacterium RIFCSPLOWO2_01_FULL_47_17]OGL86737.1 MAG: uracil phosphoribosyltransferase [Candidatus Uhrbacteria bacterium RIFCSPLOWO2_02_FULL_48_18]